MKYIALALAISTACALNAQTIIPGQSVLLGDVLGSTFGGAHIQYDTGLVTVSLGEIATPHPIYNGSGWIAKTGANDHLILPLQSVGSGWGGTFVIPQTLPFFNFDYSPSSYFLVIAYGGYPTLDVNDTVVTYKSSLFLFLDSAPIDPIHGPGPVIPVEDPVVIPPQVPEPGAWALLTALFLAGFAGYRRLV